MNRVGRGRLRWSAVSTAYEEIGAMRIRGHDAAIPQQWEREMNGRVIGNLILMTLVCVIVFVVYMALRPAHAADSKLPAEMFGKWCVDQSNPTTGSYV